MQIFSLRAFTLVLCFWSPLLVQSQGIPWVLPWNDNTASITDLSAMNSGPATNRVSVDGNGHFTAGGNRVRFMGVNFAGDSPFMPTNYADSVAARLAKFGVNNVRFHHMDAAWAFNGGLLAYDSNSSTNIKAANLERLHFLVSRLKAHGVYANINLLVGREYRRGDGLGPDIAGMDWKDLHVLGFFYPPALQLHKDYAKKVLTAPNRFTGMTLAQDPAVAFVEIINENGIIQKWLDGGLDKLPAVYAASLQSKWNQWLLARYVNDAALQQAWDIINQPLGTNMIANGSFSNGLTGWNGEQHNNAKATFTRTYEYNGAASAKVVVTTPGTEGWYVQFNYPGIKLSSNQAYTISFAAKSSPATNADVTVMQAHADWLGLGFSQSLALTTNWQRFTNTFQPASSDTNARVNFGSMGNKLATFWFADVKLQQGGQLGGLPAGSSLASMTVPTIRHSGAGFLGTRSARRDWLRFLREVESTYYSDMVAYIKTTCGYPGLIFGTIMANSPATVQSQLDVIDGHSYWQHPQFPGVAWDSTNWFVKNISMVNASDDGNTLVGLARQRIKGKPFTVTEYQHSSPNYYGAEGPLLLAAYGGLQDWDGIWIFDYGHGNPSVTMGYVRGYFDLGQQPTKLSNLPLAANLFRRGDVKPALTEVAMSMTPERELENLLSSYAWGLFSSSQLGVPGKLAFTTRLSTSIGTNGLTSAPSTPSGPVYTSDTGELRWDASVSGKGLVSVNSARTKLLVGYSDNRPVTLGALELRPLTTQLGWCTLGITLMSGESFTNNCRALITATGWWENTGQVWQNAEKSTLGNQWGRTPVLTEAVPFRLTLPVGTNSVRVWALDERGRRRDSLRLFGDAVSSTLIATNTGTVWYELEVSRSMANFESWRGWYFSATELANPSISGPSAAPNGDGVANFLKYYYGLPGGVLTRSGDLPAGKLMPVGPQSFLGIEFSKNKAANDVIASGEVSSDLQTWNSGPEFIEEQTVSISPELDRVTIRDLSPVEASTSRFMRLKVWPVP